MEVKLRTSTPSRLPLWPSGHERLAAFRASVSLLNGGSLSADMNPNDSLGLSLSRQTILDPVTPCFRGLCVNTYEHQCALHCVITQVTAVCTLHVDDHRSHFWQAIRAMWSLEGRTLLSRNKTHLQYSAFCQPIVDRDRAWLIRRELLGLILTHCKIQRGVLVQVSK